MESFKSILNRALLFALLLCALSLNAEEGEINRNQIPYLVRCKELSRAIDLYRAYYRQIGRHDFEILQQMCLVLLDEGAHSKEPGKQLLSIYGSGIAGISASIDILEAGIKSPSPETQIAAIQFLGRIQDDRSDELLTRAMSSDFFFSRMEAALQLATRKHRSAVGQIEALMYKIPPQLRFFFPQFFALIGTSEAIAILRHLMDDRFCAVRIEAILSAAQQGRDDLIPPIRASMTHLNPAEQEACIAALGALRDSKSLSNIKKFMSSPSTTVALAACSAVYNLGGVEARDKIIQLAKEGDLFAIATLAGVSETENVLAELAQSSDTQIRLNAAMSLLKRRDKRCIVPLLEILIRDTRDLGFQPQFSLGRSLISWKVVPSAQQHSKQGPYDYQAISLSLREMLLHEALELSESEFLFIAEQIFHSRQSELVPVLVALIENLQTPAAIQLLQKEAQKMGAPLVRAYCNLVLFRMNQKGNYEETLKEWLVQNRKAEMIRFRPMIPLDQRLAESPFELTLEESSHLLIDSYQALADRHEEMGIDLLLDAIKEGNPQNRYVLAGLLIHALQ